MCVYIYIYLHSLLSLPLSSHPTPLGHHKMPGWTPHFSNVVVQSLGYFLFFVTPWTAARQASLSLTISWSLLKLVSIESVMPSNHLILCRPFLLLPSIFPSITIFSNESALCIRWPKYWSFSFGISPSNEYSGWICFFIFHTGMFKLRDACRIC